LSRARRRGPVGGGLVEIIWQEREYGDAAS